MAILACYLLICTVRMTMPGLDSKDRNRIFLLRLLFGVLGAAAGYALLYACFKAQGKLIRDPFYAQKVADYLMCIFFAIGEYVTRRHLRRLNIFPPQKKIPWTY